MGKVWQGFLFCLWRSGSEFKRTGDEGPQQRRCMTVKVNNMATNQDTVLQLAVVIVIKCWPEKAEEKQGGVGFAWRCKDPGYKSPPKPHRENVGEEECDSVFLSPP